MRNTKSHYTMAVVLVAATMLIAGGMAVASNTGFKINKPMVIAANGAIGQNWTSIPFFSPYTNGASLCAQLGLVSTGVNRAQLTKIDAATAVATTANCGAPAANTFTWAPGQGIKIRNAQNSPGQAPTSVIIVGSHNPSLSITIPDSPPSGPIGNYWFSVPYHTTAITAADLCASIGLTSSGVARGSVGRLNSTLGTFTAPNCGTPGATTLTLVLGEAVRLREPNGPISFVPSHF
jgi:hypothetical protein